MTPHANTEANGVTFGRVRVAVNVTLGDCIITAPKKCRMGEINRNARFLTTEEMQGAYEVQKPRADKGDELAKNWCAALNYAVTQIENHRRKRR